MAFPTANRLQHLAFWPTALLQLVLAACGGDADSRKDEATHAVVESGSAAPTPKCKDCLIDAGPPLHSNEVCGNGRDDDDDGSIDNGCDCEVGSSQRCFRGAVELAGVGICKWGMQNCVGDKNSEFLSWGECRDQGRPGNEQCDDGLDNDCDGEVDEECGCKDGDKVACTSACGAGERICKNHEFSACSARAPSAELCNGVDDDCDGTVDEVEPESCSNECGGGQKRCVNGSWSSCSAATPEAESCNGRDDDCDGVVDDVADRACSSACGSGVERCVNGSWSSCSAATPAAESCNGRDDDCDGRVDDLAAVACSSACGTGTRSCVGGSWSSCSAPEPKTEVCNGTDDDCDGRVDDGLPSTLTFQNECRNTRIFVVLSGCNVCRGTCNGRWVDPGEGFDYRVAEDDCVTYSAFGRTKNEDICLDENQNGDHVGETRDFCFRDCRPRTIGMNVQGGDC